MAISFGPKLGLFVDGALGEPDYYEPFMKLLRAVDALVQPNAVTRSLGSPPSGPADGEVYIVAAMGTSGEWSGMGDHVARWSSKLDEWEFYEPRNGWLFYVDDEDGYRSYTSNDGWTVFPVVVEPPGPESDMTFAFAYMDAVLTSSKAAFDVPEGTHGCAVGFPQGGSGKFYFEFVSPVLDEGSTQVEVGLVPDSVLPSLEDGSAWGGYWFPGGGSSVFTWSSFGVVKRNGSSDGVIDGFQDSDFFGIAVDFDLGLVWPMKNGTAVVGDPVAGTGGYDISGFETPLRPFAGSNGDERQITGKFGTDQLAFPPPAGFSPWFVP